MKDLNKKEEKTEPTITQKALINLLDDITKARDELAKVREYLDNIIESMIETLIVVNPDGAITMANKATCRLLDYKEDELIGKPVATICEGEINPLEGTPMKKLIEEGSVRDYDMSYKMKSGEKIPVSFSGSALRDRTGNLIGIVGIARDMREVKRLMQKEKELAATAAVAEAEKKKADELGKAYKKLTEMQARLIQSEKLAAVGILGGGAAHELNNPLTSIAGLVSYVKDELDENDKNREILQKAVKETKRCSKIVTDLLTFSRPETEKASCESCNEIIDKMLGIIGYQLEKLNIKIIKNYVKDLPKIWVNLGQMRQVFLNLITNAREAMENSENKELRIKTRSVGDSLEIEFCDTGRGISKEKLHNIFDPFFTTKEVGKGVGLGLSVVRNIIEMHRGEINIMSEPGKGTKVAVRLPLDSRAKG